MKLLTVFLSFFVSSMACADANNTLYVVGHMVIEDSPEGAQVNDRGSYFGLKGMQALGSGSLKGVYKLEFGLNGEGFGLSKDNGLQTRYLFTGLKGNFGELRMGRQDNVYNIVDNALDGFLTHQGNGLLSDYKTENLLTYVGKLGGAGFAISYAKNSSRTEKSLLLNYLMGPLYLGLGLLDESGSNSVGQKWVASYVGENYGIGFVHEKCPSRSVKTNDSVQIASNNCSEVGGDNVNNISGIYRFGKPYIAGQYAKNQRTDMTKSTIEAGVVLERAKVYVEFDKMNTVTSSALGIMAKF